MSDIIENKGLPIGAGPLVPVRKGVLGRGENLMLAAASILVCCAMLSIAVNIRLYAAS